jgi:transposase-like protein
VVERQSRLRAEVKQLSTANDILRTASAFFAAAELARRLG